MYSTKINYVILFWKLTKSSRFSLSDFLSCRACSARCYSTVAEEFLFILSWKINKIELFKSIYVHQCHNCDECENLFFLLSSTITIIVTSDPHHQSTRGAQPSCSPVFRVLRLLFSCCLRNTRYVQMAHYFSIAVNSSGLMWVFFFCFCLSESFASEILSSLCSLVGTSADKNTCTRALWVISKQNFPQHVVAKKVRIALMFLTVRGTAAPVCLFTCVAPPIQVSTVLDTLESVWRREDIQSVVMEHEALNVVIR